MFGLDKKIALGFTLLALAFSIIAAIDILTHPISVSACDCGTICSKDFNCELRECTGK